jgi:hypothetical protein
MTGHKNGKFSNLEIDATDRNNVKYLIDAAFDGESNGTIENRILLLFVEK